MADLSTIGVKFGYAVETTAGVKPSTFTRLMRAKNIGGIDLTTDKIDVTALDDSVKQYTAGIADTGGEWPVTFGVNNNVITQLETLKSVSDTAKNAGKSTWFVVYFPSLTKSFFVKAEVGKIPMPEVGVGNAAEVKISLTINEYVGLDTAIEPDDPE